MTGMKWHDENGSHESSYLYDYNGNRYQKIVDSITTAYLYHNEDIIRENVNDTIYEYIHGPGIDEPAVQMESSLNADYYYADGLGSIRQLVSYTGFFENKYRYSVWGELDYPFMKTIANYNNYSYTSRETSENNVNYYRSRFYNPNIAIFNNKDRLSKDIIYILMILNRNNYLDYYILNAYKYVLNNPINNVDPFGFHYSPSSSGGCWNHRDFPDGTSEVDIRCDCYGNCPPSWIETIECHIACELMCDIGLHIFKCPFPYSIIVCIPVCIIECHKEKK
ncbi:hypothetical protein A2Y85_03760 [candidate division WOR-3 bacterium RBG_13_43_14]|uniref:Uncharacterized protein n=1 Tax=candidate division WOR-3 bacterium RBG_13_43_14 TaxID=1802590 RepID=A0A1F4UFF7_UNCW3|nr:MAG: hypothetical protein A2Y85_03760 [candidate division WOR-3 bacterium RBG_13_43_14]